MCFMQHLSLEKDAKIERMDFLLVRRSFMSFGLETTVQYHGYSVGPSSSRNETTIYSNGNTVINITVLYCDVTPYSYYLYNTMSDYEWRLQFIYSLFGFGT